MIIDAPDLWLAWLALPLSALTVWLLSRGRAARLALDHPNARSLHSTPIPRTGGLGIVAGVAVAWSLIGIPLPTALWGGAALLAALSFADDRYGLPTGVRFLAHGLAALWLVASLASAWPLWLCLLAVLAIVWMTNLYNFMDGADGLAGGMALFGFGFLTLAAVLQGQPQTAPALLAVSAAALGFLLFNLPPARVFMGDAGSISLGFVAAGAGLLGVVQGMWPLSFPVLVFLPFIADASVTLLRRGLRGEKIWRAHKEHYYQRLIRMGWSHRKTALAEYGLMLGSGGVALLALNASPAMALLAGSSWVATIGVLMVRVDMRWRAFEQHAA